MKIKEFDPASAERAWQAFRSSIGIAAIQTSRQYEHTVAFMNRLWSGRTSAIRLPVCSTSWANWSLPTNRACIPCPMLRRVKCCAC
jgi:hypothetical protein